MSLQINLELTCRGFFIQIVKVNKSILVYLNNYFPLPVCEFVQTLAMVVEKDNNRYNNKTGSITIAINIPIV